MANYQQFELLKKSAVTKIAGDLSNQTQAQLDQWKQERGYDPIGNFADGATITEPQQILFFNDTVEPNKSTYYRWDGSLPKEVPANSSPDTTGGVDVGAWVDVGQAAIRADLLQPDGGKNVRGVTFTVESLVGLINAPQREGQQVSVAGFYSGSNVGGGIFVWDSSRDKSDHNGGTVIDPNRVSAWNGTQADLSTLFTAGAGSGCFIRLVENKNHMQMDWFGMSEGADISLCFSLAVEATPDRGVLFGPSADCVFSTNNSVNKTISIIFPNKITRQEGAEGVDFAINLAADYCVGKLKDVDLNLYGVTNFNGRGEGIRLSGGNCYLYDSRAGNTPHIGAGNVIEIRGPDCVLEKVTAYNAGYAGFRTFNISGAVRDQNDDPIGDCLLLSCDADNFRVKGFVNNGNARAITLDNFKSSFNEATANSGSEYILGETGAGNKLYKLIIKNTNLLNGRSLSNTIKFVAVRFVEITDSKIVTESNVSLIRYQNPYIGTGAYERTDVTITNSELHHKGSEVMHNSDTALLSINVKGGLLRRALGSGLYSFFDIRGALHLDGVSFKVDSGDEVALYRFRNLSQPPVTGIDPVKVICKNCENIGDIAILFAGGNSAEGPNIASGFSFLINWTGKVKFTTSYSQRTTAQSYLRDYFNSVNVGHFFVLGSYFQRGDRLWQHPARPNTETDPGWICTQQGVWVDDANSWAPTTSYALGGIKKSDNRAYQCITAGTSGTDAISGTGSEIIDGSCVWRYLSGLATLAKMPTVTAISTADPLA